MKTVLVANRGEIAVRVMRTLREMAISPVAVYSDADRDAPHVRMADRAVYIGEGPAAQSYLNGERILDAARATAAEGIHPGYGFLSENADFAARCRAQGLLFIGPASETIALMGSKTAARARMQAAGVPVVPGGSANDAASALQTAEAIGFPVLIKASAGGGGKGMRRVERAADVAAAYERATSEAHRAFGDGAVYIEKALERPRHVEIQVLGDCHGNVVHLFERDCSIQRRHQKVIEETPCPTLSAEMLERMTSISVQAAREIGYFSAGTFEFLVAAEQFYFLEMNTRLQVEHPITELVTGIDLVREMIRVARGDPLGFSQDDVVRRGAAIQCRIYAEDPARNFLPSPGLIEELRVPAGPGVRDDSGITAGYRVTPFYDPLLSKLCVWAPNRQVAIERMRRALAEYRLSGLRNNLGFHRRVMVDTEFRAGSYDTGFIERRKDTLLAPEAIDGDEARDLATAIAVAHAHEEQQRGQARAAKADATPSAWTLAERERS